MFFWSMVRSKWGMLVTVAFAIRADSKAEDVHRVLLPAQVLSDT